jgi:hypothetical protein
MAELKDEVRPKPGEDAVAYAERVEARLERHHKETGERFSVWSILPGEGPGEALERDRKLSEAEKIRKASRERAQPRSYPKNEGTTQREERDMSTTDESSRSYRIKSQERDVERAIADFQESEKRLYRRDGSKVYGEAEHAERFDKLTSELSEKVEAVISEAQEDGAEYEQEALALSYTDPTKGLIGTDRERLSVSLPLVREDCQSMPLPVLAERLRAVSAGSDRVAKILHARYANSRAEALDRRLEELARNGGAVPVEDAAALRELREAVSALEEQTEDKDVAKRREAAKEAASKSRSLAMKLRRRRSEVDGSDETARQEYREHMRSTI